MKHFLFLFTFCLSAACFYSCNKSKTQPSIVLSTDEFIKYSVNGIDYNFTMPTDSVFADSLMESPNFNDPYRVFGSRVPVSPADFARIDYVKAGTAQGSLQAIKLFYTPQTGLYPYTTTSTNPVFVTITEYGNVNAYIAGNFSGLFIGPPPGNNLYNVICSFRVRRRI